MRTGLLSMREIHFTESGKKVIKYFIGRQIAENIYLNAKEWSHNYALQQRLICFTFDKLILKDKSNAS